jgi:hypothetical protein
MKAFTAMKKPPQAALKKEHAMEVEVSRAVPETVRVTLTGFGVVQPLTSVTLSSEVSGVVTRTHPDLRKGRLLEAGEVLFVIDTRDYEAAVRSAGASVREKQGALDRLKIEFDLDARRMETLARTQDLALAEYRRVRRLLEENKVGNHSGVDQAEQAYNSAKDQKDRLEISLALYPAQIREAEARLGSAEAGLEKALTDLSRCTVRAPFPCRVTEVALEKGEYTVPGREMVSLADDTIREIRVSLDAGDAVRRLRFSGETPGAGWFSRPEPVVCQVAWSGAGDSPHWEGVLDRVVDFDRSSRTLLVAVRIDGRDPGSETPGRAPLVEDMFCTVRIPGRELQGVYRVPRWCVTTDNTLFLFEGGRLKTRSVTPVWSEGETIFLSEGLNPEDLVITTRLVNPLENTRVTVSGQEG